MTDAITKRHEVQTLLNAAAQSNLNCYMQLPDLAYGFRIFGVRVRLGVAQVHTQCGWISIQPTTTFDVR
jgi:hypothetical protein